MRKIGREIKEDKWYVVYWVKSQRNRIYISNKTYKTKLETLKAIKINYPELILYLEPILGSKAKKYGFKIISQKRESILKKILKYDYPPETKPNHQSRKSFRTKYRRWKRDFKRELKKEYAAT